MGSEKNIKRVLVVSANASAHGLIRGLLPQDEFPIVVHTASAAAARRTLLTTEFDLMVVNTPLPDELGSEIALEFSERTMGVLVLCKKETYEQYVYPLEEGGVLVLEKPASRQAIYSAMRLLCAVVERLSRLERRNKTLQDKMTDIRMVNRAKWLLIENLGMTEKEAHYHLEKQAMDMRLSRREVAEHIIRTYDK